MNKPALSTYDHPGIQTRIHEVHWILKALCWFDKETQTNLRIVGLLYSEKVWWGKCLVNLLFLSIWQKIFWQINRSANRLLIVSANLDGFSLMNHGQFAKFIKLPPPAKIFHCMVICFPIGNSFGFGWSMWHNLLASICHKPVITRKH